MSLPEQKTVSIITCRFSIPSWKKSRGTHGTGDTLSDVDPRQVLPISMQTKNSFLPFTLWCSVFKSAKIKRICRRQQFDSESVRRT